MEINAKSSEYKNIRMLQFSDIYYVKQSILAKTACNYVAAMVISTIMDTVEKTILRGMNEKLVKGLAVS